MPEDFIAIYPLELHERINKAIEVGIRHGGHDGEHHKTWVIDQMLRALLEDRYEEVIQKSCEDENGFVVHEHDCGIAP